MYCNFAQQYKIFHNHIHSQSLLRPLMKGKKVLETSTVHITNMQEQLHFSGCYTRSLRQVLIIYVQTRFIILK